MKLKKILESDNKEFDQLTTDLKQSGKMPELVDSLNNLTQDQLDLLEVGFGDGKLATEMDTEVMNIKAKDLLPTQNEIDVGKSLAYPLSGNNPDQIKEILNGGPVRINLPLVVYQWKDKYYIVDGHHRWSQVFLLNPNCTIECEVFKNSAGDIDQDPVDMLRDFQGAIAVANNGKVPSAKVEPGMNIFDWDAEKLGTYVEENTNDKVIDAYDEYYGTDIDKSDIKSQILSNSRIMKRFNKPVPGAPSRAVMPQTDTNNNAGLKTAKKGMTDI